MAREIDILEKLEKELSLKQLQIKSLLTITQAINDNISSDGLYDMYRSFLSWEMGIEKMSLFVISDNGWIQPCHINYENVDITELISYIKPYKRLHTVKKDDAQMLQEFDIIIPVYHKSMPIAYSLIGGIKESSDLYNKIQFITTITNIIAVAIENKRLFKRQLEQEKLQHELKLAQDMQQMLIPSNLPKEDRYQISEIYQPHSDVGGDYIDFIPFSEHRFALCIADISGKGVAAAILMASFQAKLQSLIHQYRDLETFIIALNQSLYKTNKSDKYVTFFVVEIDTEEQTLRYINAGHYPPILYNDGKIIKLDKGSTFLGVFENLPMVKEERIAYKPGALLLSFTDGLAELKNEHGDFFDDEKIITFIKSHATNDTESFNEKLLEKIENFKGQTNYEDDVAILTCKLV